MEVSKKKTREMVMDKWKYQQQITGQWPGRMQSRPVRPGQEWNPNGQRQQCRHATGGSAAIAL